MIDRANAAAHELGLHGRTSEALRSTSPTATPPERRAPPGAAARAAHQAGNRLDEARHLLAGTALPAPDGERRQAAIAIVGAEATFAACGAQRFRACAARELRRLGRPVPRPGPPPARPPHHRRRGAHRPRTRARRALCAEHATGHIAAQVHLAPKTAETHLAHIFARLEVRTRAAARSPHALDTSRLIARWDPPSLRHTVRPRAPTRRAPTLPRSDATERVAGRSRRDRASGVLRRYRRPPSPPPSRLISVRNVRKSASRNRSAPSFGSSRQMSSSAAPSGSSPRRRKPSGSRVRVAWK
jgi:hypothetical protein